MHSTTSQRVVRDVPQGVRQHPLQSGHFLVRLQIVAEDNIDQRHGLDFIDDASRKCGIEPAADVSDALVLEAARFAPDPATGQPDSEPVDW